MIANRTLSEISPKVGDKVVRMGWESTPSAVREVLYIVDWQGEKAYVLSPAAQFPDLTIVTKRDFREWYYVQPEPRTFKLRIWYRPSDGNRKAALHDDSPNAWERQGFILVEGDFTEVLS
jgi:hypothetical protein